jgi:hypothetical protein
LYKCKSLFEISFKVKILMHHVSGRIWLQSNNLELNYAGVNITIQCCSAYTFITFK